MKHFNEKYTIRPGALADAEGTFLVLKAVIAEGGYLMTAPEEFNQTIDQHKEWIKKLTNSEREALFVAERDGKIAGFIMFQSPDRKRLSHTGTFGIMISKEHRDQGLGKLLLKTLLDWAEKNPLIEKVSLAVFSTNERAIALYKSFGFIKEGRKVNEVKFAENEYADDILMYKSVK
ncbi:GNAT family N-acetyltransferase [Neobacillus sp. YIM B06451]|uniref:GNAT family N-acetyltransferase n=1 Tax=Neobacillus sp. YIM B06451 TaxID=3070994 RepID=UPI00292F4B90|nr:GNAT family N-acetyltransferase [Neobacillus sp. YIM B06451]